jgi:hypothetical protein
MSGVYNEDQVGTPLFLKYLNGAFYACYTDASNSVLVTRLARSTNGTTWVDITETNPSSWGINGFVISDITYGNGRLVLATQSNFLFSSTTGNIGSWTSESIDLSGDVKIAYGNSTWVLMAGFGGLYSTNNRVTWTPMMMAFINGTNEIVFGNGVFVVGDRGSNYWNYPGGGNYKPIWTSTDGITWTGITTNINWGDIATFTDVGQNAVAVSTDGSGLWVVLSKGTGLSSRSYVLYSTDNTATWTGLRLSTSFTNSTSTYNYYGGSYDAFPYVQTNTSSGAITFNGGFVIYQTFQDNSSGRQGVIPFRFIARTYNPSTQFVTPNIPVNNQGQALGSELLSYIKT